MSNPLITHHTKLPGTTFTLPTRGLFYNNGELSPEVVDGEVHVYPLTSIDEIDLKTPDLLFNGKAIENVFKRCIPSVLKPMELTTMDVDYLLVCLRLVSYGPDISVKYAHGCENGKEHTYSGSVEDFIFSSKTISPEDFEREFKLQHSTGLTVTAIPLIYKHFINLMTDIETAVESGDGVNTANIERLERESIQLANNIASVTMPDGLVVTDKQMISEWLISLTVKQLREITELFERQTRWGCDAVLDRKCLDCGESVKVPVSINPIVFFTWS